MPKLIDLTGKKFHYLKVIKRSPENTKQNKPKWVCECKCGNVTEVDGSALRTGNTKSCGCWDREAARNRLIKHGKKNSKLYYIWCNMKDRCYRKGNSRYADWGGRGIRVCDEWLHDFQVFYEWAMENGYKEGLSIDRIDNDSNYSPSNCRWATTKEQNKNKRKYTKKSP